MNRDLIALKISGSVVVIGYGYRDAMERLRRLNEEVQMPPTVTLSMRETVSSVHADASWFKPANKHLPPHERTSRRPFYLDVPKRRKRK